jgi:hypothetical protein
MTITNQAVPAFKSRVFLFGADMNPEAIDARWDGARFVGIARAPGALAQGTEWGKGAFGPDVWGIIVETGVEQRGVPVPLTLRDGASATAMFVGEPSDLGSLAEMLAEARYWELPAEYRDRIQARLEATRQG